MKKLLLIAAIAVYSTATFSDVSQTGSPTDAFAPVMLAPVAMPLDGTWVVLDEVIGVGNPFTNDYFWSSENRVAVNLTDLFVVTDAYDVYDNAVLQSSTPLLPDWFDLGIPDPFQSPPFTDDPNVAWANPLFSKDYYEFGPGAHSLTIVATQIPYLFIDSTVAFRATTIPFCDIKPGSYPNAINVRSNGLVPVALLGSAEVNVGDIDINTVAFGEAPPAHDLADPSVYLDHLQDVNGDGFLDLVSHYRVRDTIIEYGDTDAGIEAVINGMFFTCADSIKTVGKQQE